jgi:hypothetical protein
MTTILNEWITLKKNEIEQTRNGVTVQRKFAGLNTLINEENNNVDYCNVFYWERELYPNGAVIKTELKHYSLTDLPYTELEENGKMYYMEPLYVLNTFIQNLGYPGIINPSRQTLSNLNVLPIDAPNGYELNKFYREKKLK